MIVAVVVFSVLSFGSRGFSPGTPVFPLSLKHQSFTTSNSTRHQVDEEPLCGCILISTYHNRLVTVLEEIHREKT